MTHNNKNTPDPDKEADVTSGFTPNEGPGWSDHHGKRGDIHHYGGKDAPSHPEHHGKGLI